MQKFSAHLRSSCSHYCKIVPEPNEQVSDRVSVKMKKSENCTIPNISPYEAHIMIQQGSRSSICTLEQALELKRLDPNSLFNHQTLLSTAIKCLSPSILTILLKYGGQPNLKGYENGRYEPALITAVRYKSLLCVQILVEHGASLHKTNFYGTDAMFQAVHENALDILEYLLLVKQLQFSERQQNASDFVQFYQPYAAKENDLQQKVSDRERKESISGFHDKGHPEKQDDDDDDVHLLCPLNYALTGSTSSSCKRQSLLLLLQLNYHCRCLQKIGGICGSKNSIHACHQQEATNCLTVLLEAHQSLTLNRNPESPSIPATFPYKILKITEKRYATLLPSTEMRPLQTNFVILLGTFNLAFMAREVIRNQIMQCCYSCSDGRRLSQIEKAGKNEVISTGADAALERCQRQKLRPRNFQQNVDSLMVPAAIKNYILYGNVGYSTWKESISGERNANIQLMKADAETNANYYAVFTC